MESEKAPGWYLDEVTPLFERYWDGKQWTHELRLTEDYERPSEEVAAKPVKKASAKFAPQQHEKKIQQPALPPVVTDDKYTASNARTMAIAALVVAFFAPLLGLIGGIMGFKVAQKAGISTNIALAAIILNSIILALTVLIFFIAPLITIINS